MFFLVYVDDVIFTSSCVVQQQTFVDALHKQLVLKNMDSLSYFLRIKVNMYSQRATHVPKQIG